MKLILPLLALWLLPVQAADVLEHDATITLRMDDEAFGGFSSLVVSPDGMSFMATSDRGTLLRGEILREDGRMVGVENLVLSPILDTKGVPLSGLNADAEGLAVSVDGAVYMSFEGNHRVMAQEGAEALPEFVPKHPDFRVLINNSGLEALAVDAGGVLYAIPERSGEYGRPFPVYRFMDGAWNTDWEISRQGDYLITGADIKDGSLYVLERDLAGLFGFSSRIRRFDIPSGLVDEETLLTTSSGRFDNLEGISLWQTPGGETRALLISDDNFRFFQKNQLVEMVLVVRP